MPQRRADHPPASSLIDHLLAALQGSRQAHGIVKHALTLDQRYPRFVPPVSTLDIQLAVLLTSLELQRAQNGVTHHRSADGLLEGKTAGHCEKGGPNGKLSIQICSEPNSRHPGCLRAASLDQPTELDYRDKARSEDLDTTSRAHHCRPRRPCEKDAASVGRKPLPNSSTASLYEGCARNIQAHTRANQTEC